MSRRLAVVVAMMAIGMMLLGGSALAGPNDGPQGGPNQTPATTDTVVPGNACNTPANDNTQGFSNPPGVPTGVAGGGGVT